MKSGLPTRSAKDPSASSTGLPFDLRHDSLNSAAAGCAISFGHRVERLQEAVPRPKDEADREDVWKLLGSAARFFSALRRIRSGTPPDDGNDQCRSELRRSAAPSTPNTSAARADATTNSPERSDTPAPSPASRRSLNPRDSAKRVPNLVTLSGIHPPTGLSGAPRLLLPG
jgi:hypothetical protein